MLNNKKNLKTRSIKRKRRLIKRKTITNINLKPTENRVLLVFTETAPENERNKIKNSGKDQKLTAVFLKQLYSKSKQTFDNNWKNCIDSFIPPKNNWFFDRGQ